MPSPLVTSAGMTISATPLGPTGGHLTSATPVVSSGHFDAGAEPSDSERHRPTVEVATGKVTDACYQRHTHAESLTFLKLVAKAHPRVKLHIVADNYATHKHPRVKA